MLVDWIYEWRESASVSCNALWCEEIDRCLAARACETHIHTRPLGIPMYGRFLCRLASLLKIQTRMGRIFFPSYAVGYSDYIWARMLLSSLHSSIYLWSFAAFNFWTSCSPPQIQENQCVMARQTQYRTIHIRIHNYTRMAQRHVFCKVYMRRRMYTVTSVIISTLSK